MGQTQFHNIPGQVAMFTDRLRLHAFGVKQLTALSYEQFLESVSLLNGFAENICDASAKKLIFAVKKGTDQSIFWRTTVRIKCCKVNAHTGHIELTKLLTLQQYLHIYDEIKRHVSDATNAATAISHGTVNTQTANMLDASVIMMQYATLLLTIVHIDVLTRIDATFDENSAKEEEECVICMDRKASIMLPCAHAYCEQCIEAWQHGHKTCPVCRAVVNSSKESWVLSEKPSDLEVAHEATGYVMGLIDSQPNDSSSDDVE